MGVKVEREEAVWAVLPATSSERVFVSQNKGAFATHLFAPTCFCSFTHKIAFTFFC